MAPRARRSVADRLGCEHVDRQPPLRRPVDVHSRSGRSLRRRRHRPDDRHAGPHGLPLRRAPVARTRRTRHTQGFGLAFLEPSVESAIRIHRAGHVDLRRRRQDRGVESGIGYKITQDDGNVCGGYCAYAADDESNAYWLFDVNDILAAHDVHLPRPYASGSWSLPFDEDGQHPIIGGTFDSATSTLYLALGDAGQVGTYDRPPLLRGRERQRKLVRVQRRRIGARRFVHGVEATPLRSPGSLDSGHDSVFFLRDGFDAAARLRSVRAAPTPAHPTDPAARASRRTLQRGSSGGGRPIVAERYRVFHAVVRLRHETRPSWPIPLAVPASTTTDFATLRCPQHKPPGHLATTTEPRCLPGGVGGRHLDDRHTADADPRKEFREIAQDPGSSCRWS